MDIQLGSILSEVVAAGSLNAVALVAVKVGVAVKFHNVGLGEFFLQLRSQHNLHDFSSKSLLLGQICILDNLLGDGASALGNGAAVLDQCKAGTEGGDPVYTGVAFKAPVLLGNVSILQVHTDMVDVHILVVAGIDQTDLVSVLIIYDGIRQHTEIGTIHGGKGVICDFTAVLQLWFYFDKQKDACAYAQDKGDGQYCQKRFEKSAHDTKKTA